MATRAAGGERGSGGLQTGGLAWKEGWGLSQAETERSGRTGQGGLVGKGTEVSLSLSLWLLTVTSLKVLGVGPGRGEVN